MFRVISQTILNAGLSSNIRARSMVHRCDNIQTKLTCKRTHCSSHSTSQSLSDQPGFTRRLSDAWPESDLATLPHHVRPRCGETLDLILRQKVYLLQARRGYRANIDSHVLAQFASDKYTLCVPGSCSKSPRVLDLGAGSGVVSILFSRAHSPSSLYLLELQPQLADRASRNLILNDLDGTVVQHDLAGGQIPKDLQAAFDVVLVNPPFYPRGSRKPARISERHLAQMESSATFDNFMKAASVACDPHNPHAFVAVIHDINELPRLRNAIHSNHLYLKSARKIRHIQTEPPTRILLYLQPNMHPDNEHSNFGHHPTSSSAIETLVLHPTPEDHNKYNPEIERFLTSLPIPTLRIGRLGNTRPS